MNRLFVPALIGLLLLAPLPSRADGYWVRKESRVSSSQTKKSSKLKWKISSGKAEMKDLGLTYTWEEPPKKIKWGTEEDIEMRINVTDATGGSRIANQNTALEMAVPTVYISVTAQHTGSSEEYYREQTGQYSWQVHTWESPRVRVSALHTRPHEADMHMEGFVPDRNSQLVISVSLCLRSLGGGPDAAKSSGFNSFIWESLASQTYVYEWDGDLPVYDNEVIADDGSDEQKGPKIPPIVWIGGGGAIGVGVLAKRLKKNKKGKNDKDPDGGNDKDKKKKKKAQSQYRMVFYKEFGDTLRVGDKPKMVGARIEEITADGQVINRPDLTKTIRVREGENISILETGYNGKYRVARIQVPDPQTVAIPHSGSVIFTFQGPGGTVNNHLKFKIEDLKKITFVQDHVTFVAGKRTTETLWFYVEGLSDRVSVTADLENDKGESFSVTKPRPDKEGSYSVDIIDTLSPKEIEGKMPGYVDNCYLVVKASEEVNDGQREVKEKLPLHRFYEGVRMHIGHLKAYPVVKGSEGINATDVEITDEKQEAAIAHTRLEITLFAEDREKKLVGTPNPETLNLSFEDVPESVEWYCGRKEEPITDPVHRLGFQVQFYAVDDRSIGNGFCARTYIYEVVPSAIMLPPNRCKAKIKCVATYQGRTFKAEQTSMVIPQPVRMAATAQEVDRMVQEDNRIREHLERMRNKLLSVPQAPEFAPLIWKITLLMSSFDERFGFCMPEFYKLQNLYMRIINGEIGPLYAAESAYVWEEVYYGDLFDMCLVTYEGVMPKTMLGRIALGVFTLGGSELAYYTPREFLLKCREQAERDTNFAQDLWLGVKFASLEIIKAAALQKGMQYGMNKLSTTQVGQAMAETADLVKQDLIAVEKSLCKSYSSVRYTVALADSIKKYGDIRLDGFELGKQKLAIGKQFMETSPDMKYLKDIAQRAQNRGVVKAQKFIKACDNPNISEAELKELVLAVQSDRFAKNYLNSTKVSDKYRWRFTTENKIVTERVKQVLKKKLANDFGVHESEVTFFEATGNSSKSAFSCKKVGMDHDHTLRVRGKDLPEEIANRYWNDEYYYQVTGKRGVSPMEVDQLAFKAEQTAVSATGPESFGPDVAKVVRPKETAMETLQNPELVEHVQAYKIKEPLHHFERCLEEAKHCTGGRAQIEALEDEALGHLWEAGRQLPKGVDRTLESKLTAIEAMGYGKQLDMNKIKAAAEIRGRMDNMLQRTAAGDSDAIVEMYASFAAEGKSMAKETEMTFSLIGDADKVLVKNPEVKFTGIDGEGLLLTTTHALEEAVKREKPFC